MTSVHVPSRKADGVRVFLGPRDVAQSQHRQHQRFPITVHPQCVQAGDGAQATPLAINSGSVFLKTDKILQLGESIQVLIDSGGARPTPSPSAGECRQGSKKQWGWDDS